MDEVCYMIDSISAMGAMDPYNILSKVRAPSSEKVFNEADSDKDKSISYEEFKTHFDNGPGANKEVSAEEVFAKIDENGDSSLNFEEVDSHFAERMQAALSMRQNMMATMSQAGSSSQMGIQELIDVIDEDDDDSISANEIEKYLDENEQASEGRDDFAIKENLMEILRHSLAAFI